MQIYFTGKNVEVTPALREFTEDKLQRLEHHDQDISKINITLIVEKLQHIAEGTVQIKGMTVDIHATADTKDMYESIDALVDKLLAQIDKHHAKITDHHR